MQARFVSHVLGLSAGLLLCLVPTSEAAESRKVETRGKAIFKRNADAATPSKPLARVRLRERQRCVMSTAGLIHENCRRSCPKARFQSTRKCRRSPFPTRTYTRYLPTSMLLQRGNKIGRFRELDIGACNCLPQSPGNCCIPLANYPRSENPFDGRASPRAPGLCTVDARSNYQGRNGRVLHVFPERACHLEHLRRMHVINI